MCSVFLSYGNRISIISNAELRYEGFLVASDSQKSTITLSKVTCFGTEARPTHEPVPLINDVFDYIVFRGKDIKDFYLSKNSKIKSIPFIGDPAIVKCCRVSSQHPKSYPNMVKKNEKNINIKSNDQEIIKIKTSQGKIQGFHNRLWRNNKKKVPSKEIPGLNSSRNNKRSNQRHFLPYNSDDGVDLRKEFDFESANALFDKEKLLVDIKALSLGEKKEPEKKEMKFYDKNKSFFDNISCPLYAHLSRRPRARINERVLNLETFGLKLVANQQALRQFNRFRGNNYGVFKRFQLNSKLNGYGRSFYLKKFVPSSNLSSSSTGTKKADEIIHPEKESTEVLEEVKKEVSEVSTQD